MQKLKVIPEEKKSHLGGLKTRLGRKIREEKFPWFQSWVARFQEVAPLDWVPGPYQAQLLQAKPVRFSQVKTRIRKKRLFLH